MTQAINLANFSNNLDSSGGLNPNALNAPTPISRGGTGASTAAGAASNLGSAFYTELIPSILATVSNALYPVGSIYSNTTSTNPATLLGFGTWVQLAPGRMLMGAGGSYSAGSTGGSADAIVVSHTHVLNDPGHIHQIPYAGGYGSGMPAGTAPPGPAGYHQTVTANTGISINSTGSSGTNANLPPYLVVYMWQRTA